MKRKNKILLYCISIAIFLCYLFFADYIFNVLVHAGQEARQVKMTVPQGEDHIKFWIEEVKPVRIKWKEGIAIKGWALQTVDVQFTRDSYLVLTSANEQKIFTIEKDTIYRAELANYFHLDSAYARKGFEVLIPTYQLKDSAYTIGYMIEDASGNYFVNQHLELRKGRKGYKLVDLYAANEPEPANCEVTLGLKPGPSEVVYYFDELRKTEKALMVKGWAFLRELDSRSLKTYVVLKKDDEVHLYQTRLEAREGLSAKFTKGKLDIDSSGFTVAIPIRNLKQDSYQVGLYLVRGDKSGVTYSSQFITLDE
ncbi:MAG TPA: hypothetical protein PKG48_12870 [Bacteroidales bacterium]|nr:hypothetical protein [Bacteroidales bacterium]